MFVEASELSDAQRQSITKGGARMTYNHISSFMPKTRLKELLARSGVTREELAKLLGASPRTLAAIEKGDYDPPLSVAYRLAAALKIPIERLYAD
jgi:putative transcriptional regulator